ncbi:MAG: helix-turn-helix transcriptional regulator, partial [Clostridiales bacterium]|nr:helix-turn-helix transcriptional regulator [Clostridiales bacterium]
MSFGSKLSARRKAKGWNQTQLAEMVGVSFQTVSCWERDEYLPETDRLSAITKALDISVSVLLDEDQANDPGWVLR